MKLRAAQVQNYRCIVDSGIVDIYGRVTVLVGKNEQGKTNFLRALASFNPKNHYTPNDLPNHLRAVLEERTPSDIPVVTLWLVPDIEDRVKLKEIIPDIDKMKEFKITRFYDGHYVYRSKDTDGDERDVDFSPPNIGPLVDEIKRQAETLKAKLASHATRLPAFATAKAQADTHVDQFATANFSDYPSIDNLVKTFSTALKALPGQDQIIQEDIARATRDVEKIHAEIQQVLQKDPVRTFQETMPHFVFHSSSLDRIPNEVSVAEFIKDPEATSKGMANLCKVAGLSTQKIQELASATDTARREAYEDHYRSSISGGINEFWTQETYNIHFRIDKEKLSVSISDSTYSRRISPSDRSDGFQWYLSFYSALLSEVSATAPTVVLLDNPGLELHADGQRDIKRFLEEKLPPTTQVIYVTHSPAMIDTYNLEQVRRVELRADMHGTKVLRLTFEGGDHIDLLEPVRSAIGANLVSTLMSNDFNILVEGAADKPVLEGAFAVFQSEDSKRIVINGSVSESGNLLPRFYQRTGLPFVIYLDADSRGRELRTALVQSGIPAEKIVYLGDVFQRPHDFELEDIISPGLYHAAVQETYPEQPIGLPGEVAGKRTRQYEAAYKEKYGIGFSKRRVGEAVKKILQEGRGDEASVQELQKLTSRIWQALQEQITPKREGVRQAAT